MPKLTPSSRRALLLSGIVWMCASCVAPEEQHTSPVTLDQREQPIVVIPEFTISGTELLPESLHITKLGFTISEIRLEPMTTQYAGIAYSAIEAQHIQFDVARAITVRRGEPITLPRQGRYLVSLRLEPLVVRHPERGQELISSFTMSGFVSDDDPPLQMAVNPGHISEEPVPDPFDGSGQGGSQGDEPQPPDSSQRWTSFMYHSERSVFMPLNEVHLRPGQQLLTFNFDVERWAVEVADPIVRAVRSTSVPGSRYGVDVSRQVDSSGRGAEAFIGKGTARALPR